MKQLVVISLFMASCVNVFSQPECDVSPGEFDIRLEAMGFVDVREIDPVIVVDLMYARDDNLSVMPCMTALRRHGFIRKPHMR